MLQLEDLRSQRLAQVQDGTTAKLGKIHFLRHLLAYFVVGLNLLSLTQLDLLILILHLTIGYHHAVTVNLKVTLVGVHNHVKILVGTKHLGDDIAEAFFQHTHQCGTIDILRLFKIVKGLNH